MGNGSAGDEAHLFVDLPQCLVRNGAGPFRSGPVDLLQIALVLQDPRGFIPDGTGDGQNRLAHGGLELAVAPAVELPLDLLIGLSGAGGIDLHQVGDPGLFLPVEADAGVAVGDGPLELPHDGVVVVLQINAAVGVLVRLGHLGGGGLEAHDPSAHLGDIGLGHFEHFAVETVEPVGNVPGQLHVLLLVLAHGDEVRLIEQDIRRHQAGIGEEPGVDVFGVPGGFVLELGHPGELAEHGVALEDPAQLRVLVDVGLDKQSVLLRVQAAGDIGGQLLQGVPPELRRVLPDGDGVHVGHEIIAVKLPGQLGPVLDGPQIGAQGQIAAGLDAGEEYLFCLCFIFHPSNLPRKSYSNC